MASSSTTDLMYKLSGHNFGLQRNSAFHNAGSMAVTNGFARATQVSERGERDDGASRSACDSAISIIRGTYKYLACWTNEGGTARKPRSTPARARARTRAQEAPPDNAHTSPHAHVQPRLRHPSPGARTCPHGATVRCRPTPNREDADPEMDREKTSTASYCQ